MISNNQSDIKSFSNPELLKILNENKGGKIDVITGLSGGKDSLYLMYALTKQLHLRVKAFTWDHFHCMPEAMSSAQKAVISMGNVDWETFSFTYNASSKVKSALFKEVKRFCICPHFMMLRAIPRAIDENIPFLAIGYSPDQNDRKGGYKFADRETRLMNLINYVQSFYNLIEYCLKENYPDEADEILHQLFDPINSRLPLLKTKEIIPSILILSQYIPWDYKDIERIVYEEFKWKTAGKTKLHSNCFFEPIRGHMEYLLDRPFLQEEAAFLVKQGSMTEQEAEAALKYMNVCDDEPKVLEKFIDHIGITKDNYYNYIKSPMKEEAERLIKEFVMQIYTFQGFDPKGVNVIR